MVDSASNIEYQFGYGDNYPYQIFSASDIENEALGEPGWYAWYLRPSKTSNREVDFAKYSEVFRSKSFNIVANSHLSEEYRGKIDRHKGHPLTESQKTAYIDLIATVFCPPLYIGISKNIRRRLIEHSRTLNDVLYGNNILPVKSDPESDTDDETKVFAQRIGTLLRINDFKSSSVLFVKVVYQKNYSRSELLEAESFVNRTFLPIGGRQ